MNDRAETATPIVVRFKSQRRESTDDDDVDDTHPVHFTYFHCGECVCYFLSLIIFIGMMMGSRSWNADVYFASNAVEEQLTDFAKIDLQTLNEMVTWENVNDLQHFWYYCENVLVPVIINDNNLYVFNNHAILLGGVRIRQYRVNKRHVNINR